MPSTEQNLSDLPTEMLFHIFSFLGQEEMEHVSLLNKGFHEKSLDYFNFFISKLKEKINGDAKLSDDEKEVFLLVIAGDVEGLKKRDNITFEMVSERMDGVNIFRGSLRDLARRLANKNPDYQKILHVLYEKIKDRYYLNSEGKIDVSKKVVYPLFYWAIRFEVPRSELLKLIELGTDIFSHYSKLGWTFLETAIIFRNLPAIEVLLEKGVDCNKLDLLTDTPLCIAIKEGYCDVVKLLIDYGADINLSSNGITPLTIAQQLGHDEIVKIIESAKKDIQTTTADAPTSRGSWCRFFVSLLPQINISRWETYIPPRPELRN